MIKQTKYYPDLFLSCAGVACDEGVGAGTPKSLVYPYPLRPIAHTPLSITIRRSLPLPCSSPFPFSLSSLPILPLPSPFHLLFPLLFPLFPFSLPLFPISISSPPPLHLAPFFHFSPSFLFTSLSTLLHFSLVIIAVHALSNVNSLSLLNLIFSFQHSVYLLFILLTVSLVLPASITSPLF